ncbi:hypothetical protein B6U98_05290 [Thermoplasmatales archaeon ex4572_165]|nr:MAG: hypothetical protein B6U98_05290 [Thermoplasmatales archaeon ex4572_165]
MIDILKDILPYISGLYTLPWILVGFFLTILIAKITGREKIDKIMKKIGLILLYFFVPVLLFRIFLNTNFGEEQIKFSIVVAIIIVFIYTLAFMFAKYNIKKHNLTGEKKNLYLKTVLTNQGRSSAFIGGALLAIEAWAVPAGIYMALVGIALFAVIPYILARMHKKESENSKKAAQSNPLPWFLKLYPWYLIAFVVAAISIHGTTGITTTNFGDLGFVLKFYTAITIPAALYYVGAGIHPTDLKLSELKKLIGMDKREGKDSHWIWVRNIFILTVAITPILTALIFGPLFAIGAIPASWFAVITINSILPITSTNIFLLPYGIDRKSTVHAVTWTTLVCVPIVVGLIMFFGIYFQ